MKKLLLFSSIIFSASIAIGQNAFPKYEGYRSLSAFSQDTVRYLQYNWGINAGNAYTDTRLSEFFKVFELPIRDVEIRCTTPGGRAEVGYIRLWLLLYDEAVMRRDLYGERRDKYCLLIDAILPEIDKYSMLYEDLQPYIPTLKRDGLTIVPWKDSYKEALGPFIAAWVRYFYGV